MSEPIDELAEWWVHEVSVKTRLGSSGYGDRFAEPVPVPCWVEDDVRLVTDAKGNTVVSVTTVSAALAWSATFTPDSEVTLPSGRVARVISAERLDSGSLGNLDHLEILLA